MLEGLEAEQEIPQPNLSGDQSAAASTPSPTRLPAQARDPAPSSVAAPCRTRRNSPFPQALPQALEGLAVVASQIEEPQLGGGALLGNQPVKIARSPLLVGVFQVPAMFLQDVAGHQQQAGDRGENQQQGQPSGIGEENAGQHQKTQSVLDQRTEALQQGQGLGDGVDLARYN